jgi:hypothetical protein
VVLHGALYVLDPDGGDRARGEYAHALEVVRGLDPEVFTPADPTPQRTQIFRVHIDNIVGRVATTRHAGAAVNGHIKS